MENQGNTTLPAFRSTIEVEMMKMQLETEFNFAQVENNKSQEEEIWGAYQWLKDNYGPGSIYSYSDN